MFGIRDLAGTSLFDNFREPVPEGGVAIRTSPETDQNLGPQPDHHPGYELLSNALPEANPGHRGILSSALLHDLGRVFPQVDHGCRPSPTALRVELEGPPRQEDRPQ